MKFGFFRYRRTEKIDRLRDEGDDGGNAPRIFGLEPPLSWWGRLYDYCISDGSVLSCFVIVTGHFFILDLKYL